MKLSKRLSVVFFLQIVVLLSGCGGENAISLQEALSKPNQDTIFVMDETETAAEKDISESQKIVVYVCGEVRSPGVYELAEGSRIVAAVEAAGGFSENAAKEAVNLAQQLKDGEKINIPSVNEVSEAVAERERQESGLVNINFATVEELCTLPGIGEAKAQTIISYREKHGLFQSTEDIQKVSGIGQNLYLQIKEKIYIE